MKLEENIDIPWAINLLKKLCEISSCSTDAMGVNRVQQALAHELLHLGFDINFVPNRMRESGDLLHAVFQGGETQVCLIGHADCVRPWPESDRVLETEENLVGQGVADDKGGLVVALTALRALFPQKDLTIHFVSSPNEETGSIGFHDFFRELGEKCQYIFGFEPALDSGAPIASRFGNRWYKISVHGEASHSGRVGRAEHNAAHELAAKIVQFHRLHQPEEGRKLNVGSLKGGDGKYNTTCGFAEVLIDTRFNSREGRDQLHREIEKIVSENQLAAEGLVKATWEIDDDCPPLDGTAESEKVLQTYLGLLKELEGESFQLSPSGGAADVNYLCHPGAVTLDGLGPVGLRLHRKDEAIITKSLETRSIAFLRLLAGISGSSAV